MSSQLVTSAASYAFLDSCYIAEIENFERKIEITIFNPFLKYKQVTM